MRILRQLVLGAGALGVLATPAVAQTTVRQPQPGFNLFSVQQDVEIGRQSAVEAEKQLPLLRDASVDRYLNRIITRLAAQAPGAKYPYSIKTVNASEINAFALPGGPMYVNRGLIQAARTEAELAGVLAHEMAHVALRHGTHQASKAYLGQAGLSLLGGLVGRRSDAGRVLNTVGGVGLNVLFLKFGRSDEYEADQVGAQMMQRAGYNPLAMATLFALLRSEAGRDPSKLETFFSNHPPPADREARIRQLAASFGTGSNQVIGGFASVQSRVRGMPLASSSAALLPVSPQDDPVVTTPTSPVDPRVAAPSTRFVRFTHGTGFFAIDHPENWRNYPTRLAVSIAPEGGVLTSNTDVETMVYGVIVNHYSPFQGELDRWESSLQRSYAPFEDRTRRRAYLEDATDDLVRQILASNSYLRTEAGSARSVVIDGARGYSVVLSGRSPVTGLDERVTAYTRLLSDGHMIYVLFITPERDAAALEATYDRMIRSLTVDDNAAHRFEGTRPGVVPEQR